MKTFTYKKTITLSITAEDRETADFIIKEIEEVDLSDSVYDAIEQLDIDNQLGSSSEDFVDYNVSESMWR